MSERDNSISILKGIGIILVIIGHSCCPPLLYSIIYSFHMPLFFIASGYFFKEKYLTQKKTFVVNKIKKLYLPFVIWSVVFLLLHNLFYKVGIINSLYGTQSGTTSHWYPIKEILLSFVDIVTRMNSYEQFLLGAYWFLRSLFIGSILFCLVSFLFSKICKTTKQAVLCSTTIFLLLSGLLKFFSITIPLIPQGGYRELMAAVFLGIGFLIHQEPTISFLKKVPCIILSMAIFIFCLWLHPASMETSAKFIDFAIIPFSGTAGFIIILYLSSLLNKLFTGSWISRFLVYVGNRTLYILTFHIIAFKPAAYLETLIRNLDWHMIGCHAVIPRANGWYWVVYTISALFISLVLEKIIHAHKHNLQSSP